MSLPIVLIISNPILDNEIKKLNHCFVMNKNIERLLLKLKGGSPVGEQTMEEKREAFSKFYGSFQTEQNCTLKEVELPKGKGYWVTTPESEENRVIYFIHGGGFTVGSTHDHLELIGRLATAAKSAVFSVDYRLAPEHQYPAAFDDCFDGALWLSEKVSQIGFAGISGGGMLALSVIHKLKALKLPLPASCVCFSTVGTLDLKGASTTYNEARDWVPKRRLAEIKNIYLSNLDELNHPYVSPIHGDFENFPPTLFQAGDAEALLSEGFTLYEKMREDGAPANFEVWRDMIHCWQIFSKEIPEGQKAIASAAHFILEHFPVKVA